MSWRQRSIGMRMVQLLDLEMLVAHGIRARRAIGIARRMAQQHLALSPMATLRFFLLVLMEPEAGPLMSLEQYNPEVSLLRKTARRISPTVSFP